MMPDELATVRRAYAKQVLAAAGVADEALERAFAETEREHFLGAGPWQMLRGEAVTPEPPAPTRSISIPTISSRSTRRGGSTTASPRSSLC